VKISLICAWLPLIKERILLLGVSETCVVLDGSIVTLVLHRQVGNVRKDLLQFLVNEKLGLLIVGSSIPDGKYVLLKANGKHCPTYLITNRELLPHNRQQQIFPVLGSQTFPQPHNPFPTLPVDVVLPKRLDRKFEQMIVARHWEFVGSYQVIVIVPKTFRR